MAGKNWGGSITGPVSIIINKISVSPSIKTCYSKEKPFQPLHSSLWLVLLLQIRRGGLIQNYVMGCILRSSNIRIIAQMNIIYLLYVHSIQWMQYSVAKTLIMYINFTSTHLSNIVIIYGKYFRDVYPVRFVKVAQLNKIFHRMRRSHTNCNYLRVSTCTQIFLCFWMRLVRLLRRVNLQQSAFKGSTFCVRFKCEFSQKKRYCRHRQTSNFSREAVICYI